MSNESTQELLTNHWALDRGAAATLGERIDESGQAGRIESAVEDLSIDAVKWRDFHRDRIGQIFTGELQEGLIVIGPCSLDAHSDYAELFDYILELQDNTPDSVIALRANSAKPRTSGGWTGLWYSNNPEERAKIFEAYSQAFERNIPILTEVTQGTQLGALAPMLSGVWLGARDTPSTTLRSVVSAYHLPTGIKNTTDGDPNVVENTLAAVRKSSADNDDSGVDLGTIASTARLPGIGTGILPVETGNQQVAIIARGHPLPEGLDPNERYQAALDSLSAMCILGSRLGSAVLLDGTHDVPTMFDIAKKDSDRIIPVLKVINTAVQRGEVKHAERLAGVLAEVGPNIGKTDPNFVLDDARKKNLGKLIGTTLKLVSGKPQ